MSPPLLQVRRSPATFYKPVSDNNFNRGYLVSLDAACDNEDPPGVEAVNPAPS